MLSKLPLLHLPLEVDISDMDVMYTYFSSDSNASRWWNIWETTYKKVVNAPETRTCDKWYLKYEYIKQSNNISISRIFNRMQVKISHLYLSMRVITAMWGAPFISVVKTTYFAWIKLPNQHAIGIFIMHVFYIWCQWYREIHFTSA